MATKNIITPLLYFDRFQELDLTTGALVLANSKRGAEWESFIGSSLRTQGNYVPVSYKSNKTKQYVGFYALVF